LLRAAGGTDKGAGALAQDGVMTFRKSLVVVVSLFAAGIVWGLSVPSGRTGAFSGETTALQGLVEMIGKLPVGIMFAIILLKNITAVLFSFV
jgi:hypothetical protein